MVRDTASKESIRCWSVAREKLPSNRKRTNQCVRFMTVGKVRHRQHGPWSERRAFASTAVAAIGTAQRDKFLAAEMHHAIAAFA